MAQGRAAAKGEGGGAGATGWPEYDALTQRIGELSQELTEKNREVVARYGRNDRPEALEVLVPIRKALVEAQQKQRDLLECGKEPVRDPAALFKSLGIRTIDSFGRPDDDSYKGYVESRVMDGTITEGDEERLMLIGRLRTGHVMNPSSRGAPWIARGWAGALRCFGIDTPAKPGTRPPHAPPARSADPLALARKYAADAHVELYRYHLAFIGNDDDFFAPILILEDGGALVVGTTSSLPEGARFEAGNSTPVAARLDPSGKLLWQTPMKAKGYRDYEGGSAVRTADGGFVVFVLSYVNPAHGAATRLVKLSAKGKVLWDCRFPGNGGPHTPFADRLRRTERGTFLLEGHVYLDKTETAHAWTGEVSADGRILRDEDGPAVPRPTPATPIR